MSFSERIPAYTARLEQCLQHWLPDASVRPARLHEAMRYALLGGGKRIRPVLMYATAEVLALPASQVDGPATAVEAIHAYSLVHDDLPAMDDDDLRRGRPTCHRAFDEATAILAGDALQALAFHILATDTAIRATDAQRVSMIRLLADACGSVGMAGGQAIDLDATGKSLDADGVEEMHRLKTGALIHASIMMVGHGAPQLGEPERLALDRYGHDIGLAFQIQDDILDEEGDTETLGKTQGKDRIANKPTYPAVAGMGAAKRRARELADRAVGGLSVFGARAEPLRWMADYIVRREF
jgi:farnesyl diphosphate synthase